MQQVFGMVNSLLVKDEQTRKRNLKVRGYKVRDAQLQSFVYMSVNLINFIKSVESEQIQIQHMTAGDEFLCEPGFKFQW